MSYYVRYFAETPVTLKALGAAIKSIEPQYKIDGGDLMMGADVIAEIGVNHNVDVLRFSGQVDPRAIQAGNLVASAQIANVRIEHRGRGAQAEAQGIGWLARFFLSVLPV